MGEVKAFICDPAEIRQFHCAFDADVPVSAAAFSLAILAKFPAVDCCGKPIQYALISPDVGIIGSHEPIGKAITSPGPRLWLVPELVISAEEIRDDSTNEAAEPPPSEQPRARTSILEDRCLLHDEGLNLPIDITVDSAAHRQIEEFVVSDRKNERAGLLLGYVTLMGRRRNIHICGVCPATVARGDSSTVMMTFAAWENMLLTRITQYPGLRILGWFHSHPGRETALSEQDLFLHQHFFPHPNMVTCVFDPVLGRSEFFHWRNGEVVPSKGYGRVDTTPAVDNLRFATRSHRHWQVRALAYAAVIGVLGSGLYFGFGGSRKNTPYQTSNVRRTPPRVDRKVSLTSLRTSKPSPDRVYVLGKRDNLWLICKRFYGDGSLASELARYNGISDLTKLQVGQRIRIPEKSVLVRKVAH